MKLTVGTEGLSPKRIEHISEIVAAYVSKNHVSPADLPALIASVHDTLMNLATGASVAKSEEPTEKPSTGQVRKSVQHDRLISFLDGKPYKTLKRHLTAYGLTPDAYRECFGLQSDYPMVTAAYSEKRSGLAKAAGLGVVRGRTAQVEAPALKRRQKAS